MTLVNGKYRNFNTSGLSDSLMLSLDRVFYRSKWATSTLSLSAQKKQTVSYIEDTKIDTNSRTFTIVSPKISQLVRGSLGVWTIAFQYDVSIPRLQASVDSKTLGVGEPHTQYSKQVLDVVGMTSFQFWGLPIQSRFQYRRQFSQQTLYSSEGIRIGGLYSVRGYRNPGLSGDYGWYARQELTTSMGALLSWMSPKKLFQGVQIFGGLDVGRVYSIVDQADNLNDSGGLIGSALGFRYYGGVLNWDWVYTRGLMAPAHISKKDSKIYFNVGVKV